MKSTLHFRRISGVSVKQRSSKIRRAAHRFIGPKPWLVPSAKIVHFFYLRRITASTIQNQEKLPRPNGPGSKRALAPNPYSRRITRCHGHRPPRHRHSRAPVRPASPARRDRRQVIKKKARASKNEVKSGKVDGAKSGTEQNG